MCLHRLISHVLLVLCNDEKATEKLATYVTDLGPCASDSENARLNCVKHPRTTRWDLYTYQVQAVAMYVLIDMPFYFIASTASCSSFQSASTGTTSDEGTSGQQTEGIAGDAPKAKSEQQHTHTHTPPLVTMYVLEDIKQDSYCYWYSKKFNILVVNITSIHAVDSTMYTLHLHACMCCGWTSFELARDW